MNLRISQARKHAKGIHPGFETHSRCHQKSKTGVSVAPRKGLTSSKKFKKKTLLIQTVWLALTNFLTEVRALRKRNRSGDLSEKICRYRVIMTGIHVSQDPTFLHLVGLPYRSSRPTRWAHCPNVHMPAVHGSNPGYYACRVATPLWPRACVVWPKLSIKGAVFALAVGQVPAVEPRGSVSDFLVGYAALVTSCDSPPGLHHMPYVSPPPDKSNAV